MSKIGVRRSMAEYVLNMLPFRHLERDVTQWLERGALSTSLSAVRFRILLQDFQRNIIFLPSQYWDVVLMLCPLGKAHNPKMLHLIQMKMITWWDRDGNVYNKFNAPKWLQDCMLSVGLRWHTNEQVQWPRGKNVKVGWITWYQIINLHLYL